MVINMIPLQWRILSSWPTMWKCLHWLQCDSRSKADSPNNPRLRLSPLRQVLQTTFLPIQEIHCWLFSDQQGKYQQEKVNLYSPGRGGSEGGGIWFSSVNRILEISHHAGRTHLNFMKNIIWRKNVKLRIWRSQRGILKKCALDMTTIVWVED